MKIYKGIIEGNDLEADLSYVGFALSIEQILFLMKSISPDFIEVNGNVYLRSKYESYEIEENRFDNSRQGQEKYINNISISDIFYFSEDKESKEKITQKKIGLYILEFWKMRLNILFPDKYFEFILSENGIYDENGVCITFYHENFHGIESL